MTCNFCKGIETLKFTADNSEWNINKDILSVNKKYKLRINYCPKCGDEC